MKSAAATNSGKLITIISGDYQSIERMMGTIGMLMIAPIINVGAYGLIGYKCGWEYALITFSIWLIIIICQHLTSKQTKWLKRKEGIHNDER
jgi:ABC-type multidrug transport system fused ATPase/permease subunit